MRMSWKAYFFLLVVYEVGRAVYVLSLGAPMLLLFQLPYALLTVALFGLAFERPILWQRFWKYAFALSVLVFAREWLLNPLLLHFRGNVPPLAIARVLLFAVPELPLIAAVFIYAWKREPIWSAASPPRVEAPGFGRVRAYFYLFAIGFLLLQPVFASNAAHFGWGFFPLVASIYILPLLAVLLFADTCVTTIDAIRRTGERTRRRFMVPALGGTLLLVNVAVLALFVFTR